MIAQEVRFHHLCHFIDLIYNGEVEIEEEDVVAFVALARRYMIEVVNESEFFNCYLR